MTFVKHFCINIHKKFINIEFYTFYQFYAAKICIKYILHTHNTVKKAAAYKKTLD